MPLLKTGKEVRYFTTRKYFVPTDGNHLLTGYQRDDGNLVLDQSNGAKYSKGDLIKKDDVEFKEIYPVKLTKIVVSSSNAEAHPNDKDEDADRLKRLQPFIGCRFFARKAHYGSGKLIYQLIDIGEYVSENEIEILD